MFADGKKKTLQAMFQTQFPPKAPKIYSYKNNLINKQSTSDDRTARHC